jgi:hypothetical protein
MARDAERYLQRHSSALPSQAAQYRSSRWTAGEAIVPFQDRERKAGRFCILRASPPPAESEILLLAARHLAKFFQHRLTESLTQSKGFDESFCNSLPELTPLYVLLASQE